MGLSELVLHVWSLLGSQAVDQVAHRSPALGLCAWAGEPLISVNTHPKFQVWAPRLLIELCAHPVFQMWVAGHSLQYTPTQAHWACVPRQLGC